MRCNPVVKTFVWLLFFAPIILFAQTDTYQIKGKIGTINLPAKVYLTYKLNGDDRVDSSDVKNGEFLFSGSVKEPIVAGIILDRDGKGLFHLLVASSIDSTNMDILNLYIEKGTIVVTGKDSLCKAEVSGSPTYEDIQILRHQLKPVQERKEALDKEWQSASKQARQALQEKWDKIKSEKKDILKKFIHEHPSSYASIDALKVLAGYSPEYADIEPSFRILSPALKETDYGKSVAIFLEENKGTAVGALAMDFTQNDVSGKPVKLSDFRGKYVLLDFWASWCGPCRQENPNLVRVFNKFKDKNFTVLGVSLDRESGKKAWLKAIETDQLAWTQVSDLKFWSNEVAVMYGIQSIPQNFLIDPDGKIIAKNLHGEELDAKLAEIFN